MYNCKEPNCGDVMTHTILKRLLPCLILTGLVMLQGCAAREQTLPGMKIGMHIDAVHNKSDKVKIKRVIDVDVDGVRDYASEQVRELCAD